MSTHVWSDSGQALVADGPVPRSASLVWLVAPNLSSPGEKERSENGWPPRCEGRVE
jgi:hypothetical protein